VATVHLERFRVRSYEVEPVGIEKLFAIREFVMRRVSDGETVGVAKSGWLVVDGGRGRPLRPQKLLDDIELEPSVVDADLSALEPAESGEDSGRRIHTEPRAAQHHDIDQYNHVNNAAYLEWALDAMPEELRKTSPRFIALDFIKETVLGDRYEVLIEPRSDGAICHVQSIPEGKALCRIRVGFS